MEIEIHKYHDNKILTSIDGINNVVYVSMHGTMD
jgi:hypothetical protein